MCHTNGVVQYTHALNDGVDAVKIFWQFTCKIHADSLLRAQLLPRVCLIRFCKQPHVTLTPLQLLRLYSLLFLPLWLISAPALLLKANFLYTLQEAYIAECEDKLFCSGCCQPIPLLVVDVAVGGPGSLTCAGRCRLQMNHQGGVVHSQKPDLQEFKGHVIAMEMVPVIGPGLPSAEALECTLHRCSTRHEDLVSSV